PRDAGSGRPRGRTLPARASDALSVGRHRRTARVDTGQPTVRHPLALARPVPLERWWPRVPRVPSLLQQDDSAGGRGSPPTRPFCVASRLNSVDVRTYLRKPAIATIGLQTSRSVTFAFRTFPGSHDPVAAQL